MLLKVLSSEQQYQHHVEVVKNAGAQAHLKTTKSKSYQDPQMISMTLKKYSSVCISIMPSLQAARCTLGLPTGHFNSSEAEIL